MYILTITTIILQASKKKVYMLYDLQPDRSVTGGAWYSDQDFESEFVDVLTNQCHKFLLTKVIKENHCPYYPFSSIVRYPS